MALDRLPRMKTLDQVAHTWDPGVPALADALATVAFTPFRHNLLVAAVWMVRIPDTAAGDATLDSVAAARHWSGDGLHKLDALLPTLSVRDNLSDEGAVEASGGSALLLPAVAFSNSPVNNTMAGALVMIESPGNMSDLAVTVDAVASSLNGRGAGVQASVAFAQLLTPLLVEMKLERDSAGLPSSVTVADGVPVRLRAGAQVNLTPDVTLARVMMQDKPSDCLGLMTVFALAPVDSLGWALALSTPLSQPSLAVAGNAVPGYASLAP